MDNHYLTLGISPSAEAEVIKAAYRALSKKYHPDVSTSETSVKKFQQINLAYETLSNSTKRQVYDNELKANGGCFFSDEDTKNYNYFEFEDDWKLAIEYNPNIQYKLNRLDLFSPALGISFKIFVLETKSFENVCKIADKFEANFLKTYFGANKKVQTLAKQVIYEHQRDIAIELNKAVRVLGEDQSSLILNKIREKFPAYFAEHKKANLRILQLALLMIIIVYFFLALV